MASSRAETTTSSFAVSHGRDPAVAGTSMPATSPAAPSAMSRTATEPGDGEEGLADLGHERLVGSDDDADRRRQRMRAPEVRES